MSAKWTSAIKTQLEISTVLKANRQLTFHHIFPSFISSNMVSLHLSIKHQIHGFTLIKDVCVNRTIQYSSSPDTYLLPRRHSVCVSHVVFSCLSFYSWAPNQSLLDLKKGIYSFPALLEFGEHVTSSRMTYLSVNVAQYYLWHMRMFRKDHWLFCLCWHSHLPYSSNSQSQDLSIDDGVQFIQGASSFDLFSLLQRGHFIFNTFVVVWY